MTCKMYILPLPGKTESPLCCQCGEPVDTTDDDVFEGDEGRWYCVDCTCALVEENSPCPTHDDGEAGCGCWCEENGNADDPDYQPSFDDDGNPVTAPNQLTAAEVALVDIEAELLTRLGTVEVRAHRHQDISLDDERAFVLDLLGIVHSVAGE